MDIESLGRIVAEKRKTARLTQAALAAQARVGLPTLKALEQGRLPELGLSKALRLLAVLGLDFDIRDANRGRPTFETLRTEDPDD